MKIKQVLRDPEAMTEDMKQALVQVADIYHCNFSLFQSLPDVWAIDQIHPLAPLQRLHEPPQRVAILSDITCDSDGKIDKFVLGDGVSDTLPVHDLKADEDYFLGVFFIGAYQETLGVIYIICLVIPMWSRSVWMTLADLKSLKNRMGIQFMKCCPMSSMSQNDYYRHSKRLSKQP